MTLAQGGCTRLFLADINEPMLEQTKRDIRELVPSATVHVHKVDIRDEQSVQSLIDACVATFGRIDYAANVAGVVPQRLPIHEVDTETYDRIIGVNEYGVSDLLMFMSKRGSVILYSEQY